MAEDGQALSTPFSGQAPCGSHLPPEYIPSICFPREVTLHSLLQLCANGVIVEPPPFLPCLS